MTGERPTPRHFYKPVVVALGKLTGFKAYVGVPHEAVQDDVLRLAGIDPENCPWPLKSRSSKSRDGLYRVLHFAWYHQTRSYNIRNDKALCAKPMQPELDEIEVARMRLLGVTPKEHLVLCDPMAEMKDKKAIRAKIKHNEKHLSPRRRERHYKLKARLAELRSRNEWALTELGVVAARSFG